MFFGPLAGLVGLAAVAFVFYPAALAGCCRGGSKGHDQIAPGALLARPELLALGFGVVSCLAGLV